MYSRLTTSLASTAIVVVAASALLFAAPGAASAHDQLLSSDPAEGQVLADPPTQISMAFSDGVLDIGGVIVVADAAGTNWSDGPMARSGGTVTQKLKPDAPDGAYQVRWRVVSSDGHPISDVIDYSVGDSATPAITAKDTPTAAPAPDAAPGAGSVSDRSEAGGIPLPVWAVGGATLGVVVYAVVFFAVRRRKTSS